MFQPCTPKGKDDVCKGDPKSKDPAERVDQREEITSPRFVKACNMLAKLAKDNCDKWNEGSNSFV